MDSGTQNFVTEEQPDSPITPYLTDPRRLREFIGRLRPLQPDVELIRLGPQGDGGYLVPDDLEGIAACFSPGVGTLSGFEKQCAERGMKVFLADGTVDAPAEVHGQFSFVRKNIGLLTAGDQMTMDDWVRSELPGSATADLLLQMDIEGSEYEALMAMSAELQHRFRVLVIEFHMLDSLRIDPFFCLASRVFDKLLQTHECVHVHPNNCCPAVRYQRLEIAPITEFTFLRRDRISEDVEFATVFPHPLDCDNTPHPSLPLPKCWYEPDDVWGLE